MGFYMDPRKLYTAVEKLGVSLLIVGSHGKWALERCVNQTKIVLVRLS